MSDWTHDNEFCRRCGDELVESEWRYCCDCEEIVLAQPPDNDSTSDRGRSDG